MHYAVITVLWVGLPMHLLSALRARLFGDADDAEEPAEAMASAMEPTDPLGDEPAPAEVTPDSEVETDDAVANDEPPPEPAPESVEPLASAEAAQSGEETDGTAEAAGEPTSEQAAFADAVPGRQERAAGRILDDEGLRGDLTDDEYQPLLDWALAQTDLVAAATANLPDDEADAAIDAGIGAIRDVLRAAQDAVVAHAVGRCDDRRAALEAIGSAWASAREPVQALADRLDSDPDLAGSELTAGIAAALRDVASTDTPSAVDALESESATPNDEGQS